MATFICYNICIHIYIFNEGREAEEGGGGRRREGEGEIENSTPTE